MSKQTSSVASTNSVGKSVGKSVGVVRARRMAAFAGAVDSVVERLEDRRLMAGDAGVVRAVPYALEFDQTMDGVVDKDGEATGFSHVQVNSTGTEYAPNLIDLNTVAGVLKITAQGTATSGSNYEADGSLKNVLETKFDATIGGGWSVSTRLIGPLTQFTANNSQAGLIVGVDRDNYIKLVVTNANGTNYLQFIDETKTGTSYSHTIPSSSSYINIGSFGAINTLDLYITGDAATGKIIAYRRLNNGALQKTGAEITYTGTKKALFFGNAATAGLMVVKKSSAVADVTATFDKFEIIPGSPATNRPSVVTTRPGAGAINVSTTGFVAADLNLPTPGQGVDASTLTSASVKLYRTSDGAVVPAALNTDAAGGAFVLVPSSPLEAFTTYTFEVNDLLKDTGGTSFAPFTARFTTGTAAVAPDANIAFEKVSLPTATGVQFTGVKFGPDGKLYANTYAGDIYRYDVNADGTLGTAQVITTIRTANANKNRLISGIVFDPASTSTNLIAYVMHGEGVVEGAQNFSSKLTRLSGANLETAVDLVNNLPRSYRDHLSNQPSIGPDGALYFQQGSLSAMGAPDNGWGQRKETILSAAILRVDLAALDARVTAGQGALNVKTTDAGGAYDPFGPGAAVTIYATGIRNAYDMVWHSNGRLYVPTNGSAAGGALPATPTTAAVPKNNQTQDDWLYDVVQGGYYGHPNPSRNELYAHGGNPTGATDSNEVIAYPVGTPTDPNYQAPAFIFGANYSPNGVIEYKSDSFGGLLKGKILVVRYSGGDDILIMDAAADGSIVSTSTGANGLTGFTDPLDLVENTANGNLYVVELGGEKITLLRPITPGPKVVVEKPTYYFNDVRLTSGTNVAGPTQFVTIKNNGTQALTLAGDALTIGGADAGQFVFVNKPALPTSISPGQSLKVGVAMNATSLGLKVATLTVKSNDPNTPTLMLGLRGLGTAGVGGNNEPSLQAILNLYQVPVNTGDTNPNSTLLSSGSEPLGASDEITGMERLVAAGGGPVTITPMAVMGISSSPALTFGYYKPGQVSRYDKTQLFTVPTADAQSVNPTVNGDLTFDPGATAFGLYTTWPAFRNADGVTARDVYSEDALNTWNNATTGGHKYRFYQYKTPDGTVVPNTYVAAVEEYTVDNDQNDIVFLISNVKAAAVGPEIGFLNMDGVGFDDRLITHRINNENPTIGDKVHDVATLRVRNTGSAPLTVSGVTVSAGWAVLNAPANPIAAGGFYDLQVKLTGSTPNSPNGVYNGTVTVNSNDADEPVSTIQVASIIQHGSEQGYEPSLQTMFDLFGYKTKATYPGQSLDVDAGKTGVKLGDEILSSYWQRADGQLPVNVRQLAAFHTQGNSESFQYFSKGSPNSISTLFTHDRFEGQSFLPAKANTNYAQTASGNWSPNGVFGIKLANERSEDALNTQDGMGSGYGHHIRFYPAKDQIGNVIPNTYLVLMDYSNAAGGANYDFQDNVYLVSNIKPEAPATVGNLTATGDATGVGLAWTASNPNNLAGYNVYRSTAANGAFAKLNATTLTANSYADTNAAAGTTYFYRVVAVDVFGTESATPATASGARVVDTTPPAVPTGFAATGNDQGIGLTWNANPDSDLAGYNLYRSDASSGTYVKLNASLIVNTFYTDTTAPIGVASFYRLSAIDGSGLESTFATNTATRTADATPPAVPSGVLANGSVTGVTLDWTDNTEPDLGGYNVYFSDAVDGTFTKLNTTPLASSFFSHAGAPADVTSYYRITAVDAAGNESAPATTSAVRLSNEPPSAPTGLTTVGAVWGITLDWADNAESNLAGYNVFRSDAAGGVYAKVNGALLTGSSFVDTGAPVGVASYYYVVAVDTASISSSQSAVKNAVRTQPPSAGTTVRINAGGNAYNDSLGNAWSGTGGFIGGTSSNNPVAVANTVDDPIYYSRRIGPDFTWAGAVENGTYTLRLHFTDATNSLAGRRKMTVTAEGNTLVTGLDIAAEAGGINRALVKEYTVTVSDGALNLRFLGTLQYALVCGIELLPLSVSPSAPAAPSGLSATAASTSRVNLGWTDNANNEAGFLIERSADGTTFTTVTTVPADATTFGDVGRASSTQYFYRVTALGSAGVNSAASNVAGATTLAPPPTAPTSLVTTAVSQTQVALTWTDTASNETGYLVERSTDGTTFATVATLAANATSHTDGSLTGGTLYYYRVTATGTGGFNSGSSNVSSVTTQTAPATPTSLAGTPVSQTQVALTWVDNATNENGYLLERSTDGTTFAPVTTLAAGATGYTDGSLNPGTQYFYRVTATVLNGVSSAASNVAPVTTQNVSTAGTTVRINAGGNAYNDSLGNAWSGTGGFIGGTSSNNPVAVANTVDDPIYYSRRIGPDFTWAGAVENGTYTLRLHFTDATNSLAGRRKMTVTAEGNTLVTGLDIAAEAGGINRALVKEYTVTVSDGALNLRFLGTLQYALVCGIELLPQAAPAPVAPSSLAAASTSSTTMELNWADNATNETGFLVERSTDGTNFAFVNTVPANVTAFADTGLTPSTLYHYRVTAMGSSVNSAPSDVASALTQAPAQTGTTLRVNAGNAAYIDGQGNTWGGSGSFTAGTVSTTAYAVAGTDDDALYYVRRWGADFSFNAAVANGTYTLKLHFADPTMTATNRRVFSVQAEGATILSNFDIYAQAGPKTAIVKTFTISVTDGQLDLRFLASKDNAIISAIELVPNA